MSDEEIKNYYQILGVSPSASDDEIAAAYRALAAKYHPDISNHDDEESRRFKDVSHAFQILSDPQKRRRHDQRLARRSNRATHPASVSPIADPYPSFVDALFSSMFADAMRPIAEPLDEHAIQVDLPITPEEARLGATISVTIGQEEFLVAIPPGTKHGTQLRVNAGGQSLLLCVDIRPCW